MARLTALVAVVVLAAAASAPARAPNGSGLVVFSVFSGLPPFQGDERCEGLYASRPDGSGLTRLTGPDPSTYEGHYWPALSPDGRTALFGFFARRNASDLALRVFSLDLGSGQARELVRSDYPLPLVWSPKGDAVLVYRALGRRLHLARVDPRTGRVTDIVGRGFPSSTLAPSWAPDASRVVFTAAGQGPTRIWTMRADGSRKRRLGPRGAEFPAWSPDGRQIAFFRSVGAQRELWVIRPDGRRSRRLARGVLSRGVHSLVWSPSGRSLLFLRRPPLRPFYPGQEHEVGDLFRLDLDSGRSRRLTRKVVPLAWAGDGRLLLLRPRLAAQELVFAVVIRSGSRERVIGVTDEEDVNIGSYPAWQPRRAATRGAAPPFTPRVEWSPCLDGLRELRAELGG